MAGKGVTTAPNAFSADYPLERHDMAKMKNEDFLRDARVIVDRLDRVGNLNKSSLAILRAAKAFIEFNDGRYPFELAKRADFMHYFCAEMRFASDEALERMRNDPTSLMYEPS
jgi:hypothetical protein